MNDSPELYAKIVSLMLNATFCLQPPGDSPSRKSIVDSIVLGCIPVLFAHFQPMLWPWHIGDWRDVSVTLDDGANGVIDQLKQIPKKEIKRLHGNVIGLGERLTYQPPGTGHENDALGTILSNVIATNSKEQRQIM